MQDDEKTKEPTPDDSVPAPCETPAAPTVCGTLPECDQYKRGLDRGYSMRRAFYVGLTTAWCIVVPVIFVFTGHDTDMAKQVSTALLGLSGTVCICYLGAGVIDKQRFLERLGDGIGRRRDGDGDGDRDHK